MCEIYFRLVDCIWPWPLILSDVVVEPQPGSDYFNAAEAILKAGGDANSRDNGGFTPLHYAGRKGFVEVPKDPKHLSLEMGANL